MNTVPEPAGSLSTDEAEDYEVLERKVARAGDEEGEADLRRWLRRSNGYI